MEIDLRLMQASDYDEILKMVITTWDYRSWVPKDLVWPMAEYFLSDLLQKSDHIVVVTVDGKTAGICAGDVLDYTKIQRFCLRKKTAALGAILKQIEPDSIFEKYIQTMALDQELLLQSNREFEGGLNLLLVNGQYRGLGLGKKLYNNFCEYLQKNGVRSFYLYTDDSSDYGFYEHNGLEKLVEKRFYWDEGNEETVETYYLYGRNFS